jgi:hypothetical protein
MANKKRIKQQNDDIEDKILGNIIKQKKKSSEFISFEEFKKEFNK